MIAKLTEKINTLGLFSQVTIGPLPDSGNAVTVFPSGGGEDTVYYDRHVLNVTEWTFRCRHEIPLTAYDTLYSICNYLHRMEYPMHGEGFDLLKTETAVYPQPDNEEKEDPTNIYKAVIKCSVYF